MAILGTWANRIPFIIPASKVDDNEVNFPSSLFLSTTAGATDFDVTPIFDVIGANSKKIAITMADGVTQADVEIELWDSGAEKAVLWFRIPGLSSSVDNLFYIYFDNTQPDNNTYVGDIGSTPGQAVWDEFFKVVLHMNQDPTGGAGCIKDSTVNAHNGTPQGTMIAGDLVDGAIGKALKFNGTDADIDLGATGLLSASGDWTVESLASPSATASSRTIFAQYLQATSNGRCLVRVNTDGTYSLFLGDDGVLGSVTLTGTTNINSSYHSLASVRNGNSYDVLVDGVSEDDITDGSSRSILQTGNLLAARGSDISTYNINPADLFDNIIDETRISSIARSVSWLNATHLSNIDSLVTFLEPIKMSLNQRYSLEAPTALRASLNQRYQLDAVTLWKSALNQRYELRAPSEVVRMFLNQQYVLNGSHVETTELVDIFYTLTIDDIEVPMSSFQGRARATGQDYAAIVIPNGTKNISPFEGLAGTGAELVIKRGGYTAVGHQYVAPVEFLRVTFETLQYQRGGRSSTMNVVGHKDAVVGTPKGVLARAVQYISITADGKRSVRCMFDSTLRPGDQLELPDASLMEVGVISYTIGSSVSQMQVTEA